MHPPRQTRQERQPTPHQLRPMGPRPGGLGCWGRHAPANAPAAKRSESPGRKGVSTSPVSQNTMAHRMTYVMVPCVAIMSDRCLSRCRMKLIRPASGGGAAVGAAARAGGGGGGGGSRRRRASTCMLPAGQPMARGGVCGLQAACMEARRATHWRRSNRPPPRWSLPAPHGARCRPRSPPALSQPGRSGHDETMRCLYSHSRVRAACCRPWCPAAPE